jgi:2-polyprenyl-6-methoxyphenol hydroxylase-like FAD-dependent oxidoreductase
MALTVDVISDVICPWCYVGKRRLEKAINALAGRHEVRVRWHPFQLNPQMPKGGMDRKDYRTAKFGSWQRSLALDAQVEAVGATEGIAFAFDKIRRTPNTLDAHRLIRVAEVTDEPFVQTIHDLAVPRMAFGRVCLTGDAAFVPRPHTAASTAKAAANALALADCFTAIGGDVVETLRRWEPDQMELGERLRDYGQRLGNRSQFDR